MTAVSDLQLGEEAHSRAYLDSVSHPHLDSEYLNGLRNGLDELRASATRLGGLLHL